MPQILWLMSKSSKNIHFLGKLVRGIWRNKILLAITMFVIFVSFFDKYNLSTQYKLYRTVCKLENEKLKYHQLIVEAQKDKLDIDLNYEKFAREKYFMSRDDEDVFIIEKKQLKK